MSAPSGLLVDFGGVLTHPLGPAFRDFEQAEGLPAGTLRRVLEDAYADGAGESPIGRVERGELDPREFERILATSLSREGAEVAAEDLIARIFGPMELDRAMWALVGAAREAGVRTCLVSNSWGTSIYDDDQLATVFDEVVISAAVGLRKPDAEIFRLSADRVAVDVTRCAFIDDLAANVDAARALGMHAVHHTGDVEAAARSLEGFLGVPLLTAVT